MIQCNIKKIFTEQFNIVTYGRNGFAERSKILGEYKSEK